MTLPDLRLSDPLPADLEPGMYWLHTRLEAPAVVARFERDGWATSVVDLEVGTDKAGMLEVFAHRLGFPGWVGRTWDALDDALGDLSWWPAGPRGRLIVVRGAEPDRGAVEGDHQVLLDVLETAVAGWSASDSPLVVLLCQSRACTKRP